MLPGVEISELDSPVEYSKASPPLSSGHHWHHHPRLPVHQEYPTPDARQANDLTRSRQQQPQNRLGFRFDGEPLELHGVHLGLGE